MNGDVWADLPTLECPCCGEVGAKADPSTGLFTDGEKVTCGCGGWVSVTNDDEEPWINMGERPCPKCDA